MTVDECWQLVDTAERTRRHCLMLENCCYGELELLVLRLVRQGVFGELTHGEAGYLHEARDYLLQDSDSAIWRRRFVSKLNGNLYPTHGLGPVAEYLNINAGDQFDFLVSMSSRELGLSRRRDALPAEDPRRRERFACGDINTSLIRPVLGRTILVQFSMVQSRPYSRINLIAGITGTFCDYPPRLHLDGQPEGWVTDLQPYHDQPPSHPKPPVGKGGDKGIQVKGARDLLMQLSRWCSPVPRDKILGYITRGRGLTIHSVGCPNLEALDYDRERLVEVEWEIRRYPVGIPSR